MTVLELLNQIFEHEAIRLHNKPVYLRVGGDGAIHEDMAIQIILEDDRLVITSE